MKTAKTFQSEGFVKKTENKKSITISKLAFLDEMLEFPSLRIDYSDWDGEPSEPRLESPIKFEELIKAIAAKTLSEEELLAVLGDSKRGKYWKDSATITYTA